MIQKVNKEPKLAQITPLIISISLLLKREYKNKMEAMTTVATKAEIIVLESSILTQMPQTRYDSRMVKIIKIA